MVKLTRICSVLVAAAVVSACSGTAFQSPTEGEAQTYYASEILSPGRHSVVAFKKTNGTSGEADGVKIYEMTYEAEFKCGDYLRHRIGSKSYGCTPGRVHKDTGSIKFKQTENGWVGTTTWSQ